MNVFDNIIVVIVLRNKSVYEIKSFRSSIRNIILISNLGLSFVVLSISFFNYIYDVCLYNNKWWEGERKKEGGRDTLV